ncbi:MAG: hypothetical protein J6S44_03305, partial [Clostridia bacterium]|nr:hypothetical protein [Clostridia bacterium]
MSGLCGGDATLSTLDPCSPVGLVCVLLPSLLTGGRAIFSSAYELGEASRLVHPTRLTAAAESAAEAVEILKS